MKLIITSLFFSAVLFILGYNFTFNTVITVSKFISYAKYKEGTRMYKILSSKSNILCSKIGGIAMMISALILFSAMIISVVKEYC